MRDMVIVTSEKSKLNSFINLFFNPFTFKGRTHPVPGLMDSRRIKAQLAFKSVRI